MFTIILEQHEHALGPDLVAKQLIDSFNQPFNVDGHQVYSRVSIGIAQYPEDGLDAETLQSHGDAALHQAKSRVVARCASFSPEMTTLAMPDWRLKRIYDEQYKKMNCDYIISHKSIWLMVKSWV